MGFFYSKGFLKCVITGFFFFYTEKKSNVTNASR